MHISVFIVIKEKHTATGTRQIDESQGRIIGGDGLESNVAVPLGAALLLGAEVFGGVLLVKVFELDGADGADLGVLAAELALRVEDRVDVEAGGGGPARELAEPQDQLLLEIVGQLVLGPEKDDASLGDWRRRRKVSFCVSYFPPFFSSGLFFLVMNGVLDSLVMAKSRRSSSELGASSHSTSFAVGNSRPMTGVTSKDSYELSTPVCLKGWYLRPLLLTGTSLSTAEGAIVSRCAGTELVT